MLSKLRAPIFMQFLLATLLPLLFIFSLVLATIARSVFYSSAGTAQEKTLFFAQQSAEQVRCGFLRVAARTELAAKALAYVFCKPEQTREAVRQIARHTLENTPNAYRIRIYFEPEENFSGTEEPFAHVSYSDGKTLTGYPLVLSEEPDLDITSSRYAVPLKQGVPYHDSVSLCRFGPDKGRVYVASVNYPVIRNGKVIGCVGMDMLYRKSFQFVDKWEADGSYRLLIISESGTILYTPDDELIDRNLDSLGFDDKFLVNMKNAMQRNESFMEESYSPVFRQKSLICVYPVDLSDETTRVFMYMDTPTQLVYKEATDSVQTVFFTFLGGLLLFIGSLFAATRNITKPIKKLTATADRIAHGQLDASHHDFSDNHEVRHEIDSLNKSLNLMFKEMEKSHNLKIRAMKTEYEKKRLEEVSAAKDRFFAHMSHEIRTPMNVILGMSEMMLMGALAGEQKKYAHDIKVSAESLLDIINDILDMSRLESGELPLLPVHYDFNALLENVCSLSRYLAEKKGLAFNYEVAGITPGVLYGDDGRLRQVLLNVIGNAVKFTEKGTVVLRVKGENETISFEVEDTGRGIKQADMQDLFEPFKQLDTAQNRKIEGTGLGLSICRNLLGLMGGSISVESEYGNGSIFQITIPKVPGDASQIRQISDTLPTAFDSKARVLVVDDSGSNLRVAREFLRKFGITADIATSGAKCLTMVGKTDYDLIFMDHMMPEMNGIETTERIRALGGRFAEVPIIALTANVVDGSHELFLSFGMNDFLAKPIERVKLQSILAKWMPAELVLRESRSAAMEQYAAASKQTGHSKDGLTDMLVKTAELTELDIPLGLARVADNWELYEEMLGMIVEEIPVALEKIDAAARAKDTATLTNEAHKLKGALANIGAVRLSEGAKELELAAGDRSRFTQKLDSLRPELEEFAGKLRDILSGKKASRLAAPEGWGSFEDSLRELRDALASFNYEKSREAISELMRFNWGENRNKRLETIHLHIRYFDYEAAVDDLNRLFPKLR